MASQMLHSKQVMESGYRVMSASVQGRIHEVKVGLKIRGKAGMWAKAEQDPKPRARQGQGPSQWLVGALLENVLGHIPDSPEGHTEAGDTQPLLPPCPQALVCHGSLRGWERFCDWNEEGLRILSKDPREGLRSRQRRETALSLAPRNSFNWR